MKKSKMLLGVGGVTVGLLGLGVGVAFAGIPGASGAISACRNNLTGGLRAIDAEAGQSCNSLFETGLSWSQTGPQGPADPAGPQGSSGALSIEVVSAPITGATSLKVGDVSCPTGKVATGGGFDGVVDFVQDSSPIVSGSLPTGWHVKVYGGANGNAYAICAHQ